MYRETACLETPSRVSNLVFPQNAVLDLPQVAENIDAIARIRDADVKLTQRGILQARHTGLYLSKTEKFDICFVSPYLRTRATAEEIARQLPYNVKVYTDNTLREKEFGRLHGLQAVHVKDRFPEEYKTRERDGKYWYRFPGGENYPDVEMRVMSFLERLSREYAGRSVLVVTHQVPYKMIRAVLQHLDGTKDRLLQREQVSLTGLLSASPQKIKF
jgi:2,3-bisphosphoglycerate-dependent phosphoglycerate mutase